jgi:hypothetical protein
VSLSLTICSVALWAYSLLQSNLTFGLLGSIHSYNFLYFIAIGLLTSATFLLWVSKDSHEKLLFFQISCFIVMLWLTPLLIGNNPLWADHVYRDFAEGEYIAQFGHLNATDPSLWYHNWPGVYILQSVVIKLFDIQTPDLIAKFGEFTMQFIILIPVYVFFKNLIDNANHRLAACWFFFLGNWCTEFYFNPQGFGFLLLIILLTLVVNQYNKHETLRHQFIIVLVLGTLVITHFLTSAFALASILVLTLLRRTKSSNLLIITLTFIGVWTIYGAGTELEINLGKFVARAFDFDNLFSLITRSPGFHVNESAIITSNIRIGIMALFALLALIGFSLTIGVKNKTNIAVAGLISAALLTMFSVLYDRVAGPSRSFIFSLAPVSYFSTKLFRYVPTTIILLAFALGVFPLRIIASDGNNGVSQFLPRGEIAYLHFIHDKSIDGNLLGSINIKIPEYTWNGLNTITWQNDLIYVQGFNQSSIQYVHIGTIDYVRFENSVQFYLPFLVGDTNDLLIDSNHYSRIYTNSAAMAYFNQELG